MESSADHIGRGRSATESQLGPRHGGDESVRPARGTRGRYTVVSVLPPGGQRAAVKAATAAQTVRTGLWGLAVTQLLVGGWQLLDPLSFYRQVPTVADYPPYSEHLLRDLGGLNLAIAVPLVFAGFTLDRRLVLGSLLGYLVYATSHLVFHLADPGQGEAVWHSALVAGLTLLVVVPACLVLVSTRVSASHSPPTED